MPHCGGAYSCNCVVTGAGVSGSGTLSDPYVITSVPEGGGGGGGGGGGYLDHGNQVGAVTYAASTGTHRLTSTGATAVSLTGANGDIVSIYDDGVGPLTVEGTLVTVPGAVVCHRVAGVWYAYPIGATTPSDPSDVTPPAPGSMAASAITDTGFTLTVTGADDAGGLHATPYAFSTDGGATLSAWQSSPVFVASGLTPSTPYSCRWSVRDAALNVSTGTAFTVTTTAVATDVTAPAWSATFTMGTPTLTNVTATASALATDAVGVTGYEVSYNDGTTWDAITPAGSVFTLAGTQGSTYATTKLRARDAAGNRSTPALSVPSYTLASVIPAVGNPATLQEAATLWGAEGYWKLDETTGTTMTDSSGKGRHGTISGTAPTDYTLGTAAGLLHVESLGKVIVPDDDAYSIGTYGLSVFAVFRQAGNMTTRAFITKLNEWQTGLANNTTKFTSQSDRSSGSPAGLSTMDNAFTTATWHAFATAIPKPDSGSQPKPTIWIDNGTPQAVTSSYTVGTVSANTTQTLSLGGNWVGDIGHVMIFPFALTNAHVAKLTDLARSQGLIP